MAPPASVRVATLFRVPVRVHHLFPAVALAVTVTTPRYTDPGTLLALLSFFGVMAAASLVHEAAHAMAARSLGLEVRGITLRPLGGTTECGEGRGGRDAVRRALAGISASLGVAALAGAGIALRDGGPPGLPGLRPDPDLLRTAWNLNLSLGILNLLPGVPFDGGLALEGLLRRRLGGARARVCALAAGGLVGLGLLLGGISHESILLAVLGGWSLFEVSRSFRRMREGPFEPEGIPGFRGFPGEDAVPGDGIPVPSRGERLRRREEEREAREAERRKAADRAARESTRERLDGLLDRIAAEGIGSLTEDERAFLDEESRRLRALRPGKSPTGR